MGEEAVGCAARNGPLRRRVLPAKRRAVDTAFGPQQKLQSNKLRAHPAKDADGRRGLHGWYFFFFIVFLLFLLFVFFSLFYCFIISVFFIFFAFFTM